MNNISINSMAFVNSINLIKSFCITQIEKIEEIDRNITNFEEDDSFSSKALLVEKNNFNLFKRTNLANYREALLTLNNKCDLILDFYQCNCYNLDLDKETLVQNINSLQQTRNTIDELCNLINGTSIYEQNI